mgnify:CR=1 FL=1
MTKVTLREERVSRNERITGQRVVDEVTLREERVSRNNLKK